MQHFYDIRNPDVPRPGTRSALAAMLAVTLWSCTGGESELDGASELGVASAPIVEWTHCATEGGHCAFTGTREVRYGADGIYVTRTFTDGVACNNAVFGDPVVGRLKSCSYATTPPTGERPPVVCTSPLGLADTSQPRVVVGTGTPASCTETALRQAVAGGGVITFNCGTAPTTIPITQTLVAPADRNTTIDGNDRIVLDGLGTTQILRAYNPDFRVNDKVLTVQRLVMARGYDQGTGFKPRDGTKVCSWGYKEGGGGAIYTRDVNVHVWGVTFRDNRGPSIGPDVAGGAIYMMGAKRLVVANSIFRNNSASNGGGIGLLHVASELYNVVFEGNRATGELANFANATGCPVFNHAEQGGAGGLGGAFYSDGFDPGDTFCGVRMSDNVSGDLGGALFRSAYWGLIPNSPLQVITWDRSVFERNRSPRGGGGAAYVNNSRFTLRDTQFVGNDSGPGDGGGLKITGVTVRAERVQFTNNRAGWGGGVAHWGGGPEGVGSSSNLTFSGNTPNDSVGDFPR